MSGIGGRDVSTRQSIGSHRVSCYMYRLYGQINYMKEQSEYNLCQECVFLYWILGCSSSVKRGGGDR
eukprot:3103416-Rhodomonas_salina.2